MDRPTTARPDAHLRMQERVIEWPLNEHGHPLTAAALREPFEPEGTVTTNGVEWDGKALANGD